VLNYLKKKGMFCIGKVDIERIKTGIVGVDYLMGGGVPEGRIVEVYGDIQAGKTTFAIEVAKAFQQLGSRVVYLDFEHSVDLAYARSIGLNLDDILFDQPFSLELGIDAALSLIKTGKVGLLIVDSVAAMVPEAELKGDMGDSTVALQARQMGKMFRKLTGLLKKKKCTALFLNQLRQNIGYDSMYNKTFTPGGKALKFYASVRLEMRLVSKEEDGSSVHRMTLKKQKTGPLMSGTIEFAIDKLGIRRLDHLIRCLENLQVVKKTEAGKYIDANSKELLAGNTEDFIQFLDENSKKREILISKLFKIWNKQLLFV